MKVIFEFDANEEREALEEFQKAPANASIIYEIERYARHLRKYEDRELIPAQEVAETLIQIINGEDFNFVYSKEMSPIV